ncbi:MAG TPA: PhoPQ-activated pathogenicity-like protein PqaA type, partial [Petrimonas sp.]|nr:PhoPQ-activated pathogenicity-like protein PqaA type [Petrimonas sp.]
MKRLLFILTVYFCVIVGFGQQAITPETALGAYVRNDDPTWGWEVRNRYPIDDTEVYSLLFISQKWHGMLW